MGLQTLFHGWRDLPARRSTPDFAMEDSRVVEEWTLANFGTIGLAFILAGIGDEEAVAFLAAHPVVVHLVNRNPNGVEWLPSPAVTEIRRVKRSF